MKTICEKCGGTGEIVVPDGEVLSRPIEDLGLDARPYHCLKNSNINTIGQLVQMTEAQLLRTKNLGPHSLEDVREKLADLGLILNIKVSQVEYEYRKRRRQFAEMGNEVIGELGTYETCN